MSQSLQKPKITGLEELAPTYHSDPLSPVSLLRSLSIRPEPYLQESSWTMVQEMPSHRLLFLLVVVTRTSSVRLHMRTNCQVMRNNRATQQMAGVSGKCRWLLELTDRCAGWRIIAATW